MKNTIKLEYIKAKKALLFDMDGTLFQSEPLHAKALRQTLLLKGLDISESELESRYEGVSDVEVFKELLATEEVNELIETKNSFLKKTIESLTEVEAAALFTEGVLELLNLLKDTTTKMGVVSASETEIVKLMIEYSGLNDYFQVVMGRNDTDKTKPDPEPYIRAMEILGVTPEETLIFEDSATGLKAASESKADTIQITNGNKVQDFGYLSAIANFSWLKD